MVELKTITAAYGSRVVLRNFSATFVSGELVAVIGPNGAGKSTLLKTISHLLPPKAGTLSVNGQDLQTTDRQTVARHIAYLPQGRPLPQMTVEQLVLHGRFPYLSYPRRYRQEDRDKAREATEQMELLFHAHCPLSALSGGMQQRAYLAMALAQDTEYILLDEPTTYLDISHQLELMELLKNLARSGKGIITVLHDLPLALTFADRVLVLDQGSLLFDGSPEALCASHIIEDLFAVQIIPLPHGGYGYRYQ